MDSPTPTQSKKPVRASMFVDIDLLQDQANAVLSYAERLRAEGERYREINNCIKLHEMLSELRTKLLRYHYLRVDAWGQL